MSKKVSHAKEPWVVDPEEWTEGEGIAICSPGSGAVVAVIDPEGEADEVDWANAQRIVACVNACKGMSTEGMKKGEVKKLVGAYSRLWAAVENGIDNGTFFSLREEYRKMMTLFDPPKGPAAGVEAAAKEVRRTEKGTKTSSSTRRKGGG